MPGHGRPDARPKAAEAVPVERGPVLTKRLAHDDLAVVAQVRAELRELLRHWGGPGRADLAELLTSELVTNALVHTGHGAQITASLGDGPGARVTGRLRVEVRDFVSRHPTLRDRPAEDSTSGRGLLLVHTLADAWGVRAHGVGKVLWFELEAEGVP
ncbi:ATP-binding protein [Streptomyces violaceusniger]|uniref:ATP-binding protein n=1 Tax=Streptomyces violaceusniger TaxID=68280 RepID=UPI000996EA3A